MCMHMYARMHNISMCIHTYIQCTQVQWVSEMKDDEELSNTEALDVSSLMQDTTSITAVADV